MTAAVRSRDPKTSRQGAQDVTHRSDSQKIRLLATFVGESAGLTSAEAANRAELFRPGVCYWKRISELAEAGMLRPAGWTRVDDLTGSAQTVYKITPLGKQALR